jgi:hypothetical protein
MKDLDRLRPFLYKPGLSFVAVVLAAAVVLGASSSSAETVLGVEMPKKAIADGTFRYVAMANLRDVVKFFKKKFKNASHAFIEAIDHPKVKVIHVRSGDASTAWEGINLAYYDRRVHIFVIPRGGVPKGQREGDRSEAGD